MSNRFKVPQGFESPAPEWAKGKQPRTSPSVIERNRQSKNRSRRDYTKRITKVRGIQRQIDKIMGRK